jgi:hypothetical protein
MGHRLDILNTNWLVLQPGRKTKRHALAMPTVTEKVNPVRREPFCFLNLYFSASPREILFSA